MRRVALATLMFVGAFLLAWGVVVGLQDTGFLGAGGERGRALLVETEEFDFDPDPAPGVPVPVRFAVANRSARPVRVVGGGTC